MTTFATPHDVTLPELRLECLFPADKASEHNIRALTQHGTRQT